MPFRRRSLPYHLVLRCHRRKRNRPPRLTGPSRRAIYLAQLAVRRAKRKRYRQSAILRKYRRVYEACVNTPTIATFRLDVIQDESKIQAAISKLGPGGVPWDLIENFSLSSPVPDPHDADALLSCAYAVGQLYQSVPNGIVCTTPLVFNTGASTGLTPFRSDFIDYRPSDVSIKAVASTGKVIGIGTVLQKFKSRCGTTVFVPSVNFHMPAANIHLESPQNVIRALGGNGKAVLQNDTIEWHLPAGHTVDIPICPHTNLPLLCNFVCSPEEKENHGLSYGNFSAFQATEFDPVPSGKAKQEASEHDCALRCCQCVAD